MKEPTELPVGDRAGKIWLAIAAVIALAAAGWFWCACQSKSEVSFLPRFGSAEWIIYPKPPNPFPQAVAELPAVFRRVLTLEKVPSSGTLAVKACRRFTISVNGQAVPLPASMTNWKEVQTFDVGQWLRPGRNVLEVTVFNAIGPPALWAVLSGPGCNVTSDSSWEVSYAGAVWRNAQIASQPPILNTGERVSPIEKPFASLIHHWKIMSLWLILSAAMVLGARWWLKRPGRSRLPYLWAWTRDPARMVLASLIVLWTALFSHNVSFLPASAGFDAAGHLDYIKYIQDHMALPSANQGWEMHQPPLYYLLGAAALNFFGLAAGNPDGLAVLRFMGLAIALLHIVIIFLTLRLLFPGDSLAQAAGLVLAGFIPMQLYVAHYVTNELLAACMMSATVLCLLKLLIGSRTSWRVYSLTGLCLGLALLSKVTALILLPFFAATLLYLILSGPGHKYGGWALAGLAVAVCILVCGWHYGRVWHQFGQPIFAGTRWGYGIGWWQDPGYRTAAFFSRFGKALSDPMYSGSSSFLDGLYSTCWGDSWGGGGPWNFQLVVVGFLLALLPMALLLAGFGVVLARSLRRPDPAWLLVLCFGLAVLLATVHLNLAVPCVGATKSIYGLGALSALALLAGCGWVLLARRWPWMRLPLAIGLMFWALNSFASHWIEGNTPGIQTLLSRKLMRAGDYPGAVGHLNDALALDPEYANASIAMIDVLSHQGQTNEAAALAERIVKTHSKDPNCYQALASQQEQQRHFSAAAETLRRLTELSPDDGNAKLQLATLLFQLGRSAEALPVCRETLRILPAEPDVHVLLASVLRTQAEQAGASPDVVDDEPLTVPTTGFSQSDVLMAAAVQHFRFTLKLAPDSPDVLRNLAWILATYPMAELRDGKEAVSLAQRARALTGGQDAQMLATLAAAQAEAGDFSMALRIAEKVQTGLAQGSGLRQQLDRMVECFQQQRPYHQDTTQRQVRKQ